MKTVVRQAATTVQLGMEEARNEGFLTDFALEQNGLRHVNGTKVYHTDEIQRIEVIPGNQSIYLIQMRDGAKGILTDRDSAALAAA